MLTPTELRQKRITLLRRQEDRKKRLPEFLASLSLIAKRPITETDVLSVEKSDAVWLQIRKNGKLEQANLSILFPVVFLNV